MMWEPNTQFENLESQFGEHIDTEGLSQAIESSQIGDHLHLCSTKMNCKAWSTDTVLVK